MNAEQLNIFRQAIAIVGLEYPTGYPIHDKIKIFNYLSSGISTTELISFMKDDTYEFRTTCKRLYDEWDKKDQSVFLTNVMTETGCPKKIVYIATEFLFRPVNTN